MYKTAKSLELVEVEVYGCFILCSYLFLHKTLILCNVMFCFPLGGYLHMKKLLQNNHNNSNNYINSIKRNKKRKY